MLKSKRTLTGSFHLILQVDSYFQNFLISLSEKINKKYKSTFLINHDEYLPHITLYLFSAPIKNIPKLIDKADQLKKSIKTIEVKVDTLILSDTGWIMIDVDSKKRNLYMYHKKAIKLINGLREGCLRKKYRNFKKFSKLKPEEKYSLTSFGDKHAGKLFHSHLSVAHFDNQSIAQKAFEELSETRLPHSLKIVGIQLVRTIGNESGGIGKTLYYERL